MRRKYTVSELLNSNKGSSGKQLYKTLLTLGAIILTSLTLTTACTLEPDAETMSRQAKAFPWPFGSASVLDEVYSPTIVEDVYSLE